MKKTTILIKTLFILSQSLLILSCQKEKDLRPDFVKEKMQLVWSDEFDSCEEDGAALAENWDYDTGGHGWGNGERQNYTSSRSNSFVSDGSLKIIACKNEKGKWTSARLKTSFKKSFTYGYIEFRAKLPTEKGSWPALWLLPQLNNYGQWPKSGEIDVMEYATNFWGKKTYGTVHCKAGYGGNAANSDYIEINNVRKWHNYAILWQEDSIQWYYDGKLLTEYKNPHNEENSWEAWPFDKPFYLIMNVAMGGTLGGDIPSNLEKCQMEVDYVRVYQ